MPSIHLRDMTEVFSPLTKGHIVSVIVNITNCFCLFVFDMSTSQWCRIEVQGRNLRITVNMLLVPRDFILHCQSFSFYLHEHLNLSQINPRTLPPQWTASVPSGPCKRQNPSPPSAQPQHPNSSAPASSSSSSSSVSTSQIKQPYRCRNKVNLHLHANTSAVPSSILHHAASSQVRECP